ncbi:MAG: hypothetical protein ACI814_003924, partial [Mariniblastus sp.]
MQRLVALISFLVLAMVSGPLTAQTPENFKRENLVAWCIVPFDAKNRSPESRTDMLHELGVQRCAYDWRANHVVTFEDEIQQYQSKGVEFFAFWDRHDSAFSLFQKHGIHPQIWKTLDPNPAGENETSRVSAAIKSLLPLVEETKHLGCKLGLYNHGGWGGEPTNMVAVCRRLRSLGHDHVGIVYNLHHGHGHIKDFKSSLELIKPYLLCLNLNGMVDLAKPEFKDKKIIPIGTGNHEREMIQTIIESKYKGPIGVLGHVAERDVAEVLQENIEGLEWILGEREKPKWMVPAEKPPVSNDPLVKLETGNQALDARMGFINVNADTRLDQPDFSIHCRAKLFSKHNFNIFVAKNPKSSGSHWELYSYAHTGELSFYIPGFEPAELRSGVNIVDGDWHDLAVDFLSGEQVVLKVDGKIVLDQKVKRLAERKVSEGPLTIGSLASQQVGCDGQIDFVRIQAAPNSNKSNKSLLGEWTFDGVSKAGEIKDHSKLNQKTDFVQT